MQHRNKGKEMSFLTAKRLRVGLVVILLLLFAALGAVSLQPARADAVDIYIYEESDFQAFLSGASAADYYLGATVFLMNDIYLSRFTTQNSVLLDMFAGTLEGNGHALVGLEGERLQAFFLILSDTAVVRDVSFVDFSFGGGTAGGVAVYNRGRIENVVVHGAFAGAEVGGVAYMNMGVVAGARVAATVSDAANAYGFARYNRNADVFATAYGSIENSTFFMTRTNGVTVEEECGTVDPLDESLENPANNGTVQGTYTPETPITLSGAVTDFYELLTLQQKSDIILQNVAAVRQTEAVNLYNTSAVDMSALLALEGGTAFVPEKGVCYNTFDENGYVGAALVAYEAGLSSVTADKTPLPLPGAGSKQDPYLLGSAADWNAVSDVIAAAADASALQFALANHIYLYDGTDFYGAHIPSFSGTLDGRGYGIFGANYDETGAPQSLIGTVNAGAAVKNIYIHGRAASGVSVLANTNNGTVSDVELVAEAGELLVATGLLTGTNAGTVKNTRVRAGTVADGVLTPASIANAVAVATVSGGTISRTACRAPLPLVDTAGGAITECLTVHDSWYVQGAPSGLEGIYFAAGYQAVGGDYESVYHYIKAKGTHAWNAVSLKFGIRAGETADVPVLVFARDNLTYKTVYINAFRNETETFIEEGYTQEDAYSLLTSDTVYGLDPAFSFARYDENSGNYIAMEASERLSSVGSYKMTCTVSSSQSIAVPPAASAVFTVVKREYLITERDYSGIAGVYYDGLPLKESRIYNAAQANDLQSLLFAASELPQGTVFTVTVVAYADFYGVGAARTAVRDAGIYTLLVEASEPNSSIVFAFGTEQTAELKFAVMRTNLKVTPQTGNVLFNEEIGSVSYQYEGWRGGENAADATAIGYTTTYKKGDSVGEYTLTAAEVAGKRLHPNYTVQGETVSFRVTAAKIPGIAAVVFENKTVDYDGTYHQITPTGVPELAGLDVQLTATAYKNYIAGGYQYDLEIDYGSNYERYVKSVRLTINRVTLVVKAADKEVAYPFAPVLGEGDIALENNYAAANLAGLTFACTYPASGGVGSYDIVPAGVTLNTAVSGNYLGVRFEKGTLTVVQGTRALTLANAAGTRYTGAAYAPVLKTNGNAFPGDYPADWTFTYYAQTDLSTPLAGAPKDAGSYRLTLTYPATADYAGDTAAFDFVIGKAALTGLGRIKLGTARYLETGNILLTYSADTVYELTVEHLATVLNGYLEGMPLSQFFNISFCAAYADEDGGAETRTWSHKYYLGESGYQSFCVSDAGSYADIVFTVDGNANFEPFSISPTAAITINPILITLVNSLQTLTYTGQALVPVYSFDVGSAAHRENLGALDYSAKRGGVLQTLLLPGTYEVTFATRSKNYKLVNPVQTQIVTEYTAVIDLSAWQQSPVAFSYTGGNHTVSLTFSYTIPQSGITREVTKQVTTNPGTVREVGYYAITAIPVPDTGVKFEVKNGENTVRVFPRELTFDWDAYGFGASYVYNGETRNASLEGTVTTGQFAAQGAASVTAEIRILNQTVKDAGSYTATIVITSGINYSIAEGDKTFPFTVERATASLQVKDTKARYGEPISAFSHTVTGVYDADLADGFTVEYRYQAGVLVPGSYAVSANVSSLNYDFDGRITPGTLTVENGVFSGITFLDQTTVFTASKGFYVPAVTGCPSDVQPVFAPANIFAAGVYQNVTATFSKAHYDTLVLTATVTVTPAPVTLTPAETAFRLRYIDPVLPAVSATATADGGSIGGTFAFKEGSAPQFGTHEYEAVFTPDSANYAPPAPVKITVEYYLEEEDVALDFGVYAASDTIEIDARQPLNITLTSVAGIPENAALYVNDALWSAGYAVIFMAGTYQIEIRLGDAVLYAATLTVTLAGSGEGGEENPEPNPPEENGGDEPGEGGEGLSTGALIGIIGGGVALLVAVVLIVILKGKKKSE